MSSSSSSYGNVNGQSSNSNVARQHNRPAQYVASHYRGKRVLQRETALLMYGYGDVKEPAADTIDLMEDLVGGFLQDVVTEMATQKSRLSKEDITVKNVVFTTRKDKARARRTKTVLEKEMSSSKR